MDDDAPEDRDLIEYLKNKKVPQDILDQLQEKKIGWEQLAHLTFESLTTYLGFSQTNAAIVIGYKEVGLPQRGKIPGKYTTKTFTSTSLNYQKENIQNKKCFSL